MKNSKKSNKKVLLLTSLALVAVVGASIGGTYAWLVANRTASGTVTNIGATAPNNLDIALNGGAVEEDHAFSLEASSKVADISGNGLAFFKPLIGAGSTSASPIFTEVSDIAVPTPSTESNSYMISYTVTFSSTAALDIYVSSATFASTASVSDNGAGQLHKATRVAIVDEVPETDVVKYILVDQDHSSTSCVTSTTLQDGALTTGSVNLVKADTIIAPTKTTQTAGSGETIVHLGTLTGSETTYSMTLTFRIWHEGTDAACITANAANIVNLDFGFSALNSAEELA